MPAPERGSAPGADSMPDLSILVVTYRRPQYLARIIAALIEQAGEAGAPDCEIIVVDNCPDGSAVTVMTDAGVIGDAAGGAAIRYVHETQPGVVFARNRAVAEARGRHVIFLDDDELPGPGWLAAFARIAATGVDAAFGALDPLYDAPPLPHLRRALDAAYTRRYPLESGADISAIIEKLGTGNSLFRRAIWNDQPPFHHRYNRSGGEDTAMLRALIDGGIALHWCPDAAAFEMVPPDRVTEASLVARRFLHGQLRTRINADRPGWRNRAMAGLFMAAGAVQYGLNNVIALVAAPFSKERAARARCGAAAGLGKLFWSTRHSRLRYDGGE